MAAVEWLRSDQSVDTVRWYSWGSADGPAVEARESKGSGVTSQSFWALEDGEDFRRSRFGNLILNLLTFKMPIRYSSAGVK